MVAGSCLCGKCKISLDGEAQLKALCHCADCRKVSGSMYSCNIFVSSNELHLNSGQPKEYSKPTDAGNTITSYFCSDCGTTMWRESTGFSGIKILKEGVLETLSMEQPNIEFYAVKRPEWITAVTGAEQKEAGP